MLMSPRVGRLTLRSPYSGSPVHNNNIILHEQYVQRNICAGRLPAASVETY